MPDVSMDGTKLYLIPLPGPRIFYIIIFELLVFNFLRMIYLSFPIKHHILMSSDGIHCYNPWEALWWILKHKLLHEPHFGINTSSDWLIELVIFLHKDAWVSQPLQSAWCRVWNTICSQKTSSHFPLLLSICTYLIFIMF